MFCKNCGSEIKNGGKFCPKCGTQVGNILVGDENVDQGEGPTIQLEKQMTEQGTTYQTEQIPLEYQPIGMWGYFGYSLLFSIPIIGIIVALIFSVGGASNINLKNYARAQFCVLIIQVVLIFFFTSVLGGMAGVFGF